MVGIGLREKLEAPFQCRGPYCGGKLPVPGDAVIQAFFLDNQAGLPERKEERYCWGIRGLHLFCRGTLAVCSKVKVVRALVAYAFPRPLADRDR